MYNLPKYISEENFNKEELDNLLKTGSIVNNVDSTGNYNISFDDITEESKIGDYLVGVPVEKTVQKQDQVETFFSVDFEEFTSVEGVDTEEDISDLYSEIEEEQENRIEEEQLLQAQIDELSSILDKEMERNVKFKEEASEMYTATKDLIISQRIQNGEGKSKDDFSSKFPFLPLTQDQVEEGMNLDVDQFPFLGN
jgi:hypothetical protein